MSEDTILRRRRLWLGALLLGLAGVLAGGACCAVWLAEGRQFARQERARQELQQALADARNFGAGLLAQREQEQRQQQQRLAREAADVCGNVQLFLQTALIRQDARRLSARNATLQTGNEELAAILQKQTAIAARLAGALAATGGISAVAASTDPANPSATSAPATVPAVPVSDEEKVRLLQEYAELHQKALNHSAPTLNIDPDSEAANQAERLLRECGSDLENLLPASGTLAISEAGGRVLLALGNAKTGNIPREEAIRNLLLPSGKDTHHLVLRVTLSDPAAAPALNAGELAERLAERAGRPGGGELALALFDANAQVAGVYPPKTEERWAAPSKVGVWMLAGNRWSYAATLPDQPPFAYVTVMRVDLPVLPLGAEWRELARENPGAVVGFAVALVLLLTGVMVNARLAWRRETSDGMLAADSQTLLSLVNARPQPLKPMPGSLERLQQANRGRIGEGSRILDLAKSPVLRELAARIRAPKAGTVKDARPSLREYNRSRPQ